MAVGPPGILPTMAKKDAAPKQRGARLAQIRSVYRLTKQSDPKIGWILLACFLGTLAFFVVLGLVLNAPYPLGGFGLAVALLVSTIVLGRRADRAAFAQIEGIAGAAGEVLKTIRRGWSVTPMVAAAPRSQDVVHRAVGRSGVVLIAEGNPHRVGALLAGEKRKMTRLLGDVPIYDKIIGTDEGQVPLRRLRAYLTKLPRNQLRKDQVREINNRLRAMPGLQQQIPKGALPKNVRMPKGGPKVR